MILIIDNYDSFTYNIYQSIGNLNRKITLIKNDELSINEIKILDPKHIIISSGIKSIGLCNELIEAFKDKVPILGIGFGGEIIYKFFFTNSKKTENIIQGKPFTIHIANGNKIFWGLPPLIKACMYSYFVPERTTIPDELLVTAEDNFDQIMALKHQDKEIYALMFNPESFFTDGGKEIIKNFLNIKKEGDLLD